MQGQEISVFSNTTRPVLGSPKPYSMNTGLLCGGKAAGAWSWLFVAI